MKQRTLPKETFSDRLIDEAKRFREEADRLPPGMPRELMLRRARQAETTSQMEGGLRSPGLKTPS